MASAETVILDLYRTGEIRKACLTITGGDPLWRDLDLYRGKNNQFAQKYRHHDLLEELDPDSPIPQAEYDSLMDDLWAIAEAEMDTWAKDGAFPYDKELLRLHLRTGNMKKLSRAKIKAAIQNHGHADISPADK